MPKKKSSLPTHCSCGKELMKVTLTTAGWWCGSCRQTLWLSDGQKKERYIACQTKPVKRAAITVTEGSTSTSQDPERPVSAVSAATRTKPKISAKSKLDALLLNATGANATAELKNLRRGSTATTTRRTARRAK